MSNGCSYDQTPEEQFLSEVMAELKRARTKFPKFPADIIHATAIMAEESGEAVRAALQAYYEGGSFKDHHTELVQTAAMCIRVAVDCGLPVGEEV